MSIDRYGDTRELTFHEAVKIDCWGLTDIGKVRESNQDQFLIANLLKHMHIESSSVKFEPPRLFGDPMGKLLMVADGMGGANAGSTLR